MQLDLFHSVPDDFWDDSSLPVPLDVELRRVEAAIAAADGVFRRTGHNRNHAAYRLLVRLRKQRAAMLSANDP
ncbi:MAG: hypothetical protein WBF53_13610 [Litorimonas sp.]